MRLCHLSSVDVWCESSNDGQMAIIFCVIEPVTHHKLVGDIEAHVHVKREAYRQLQAHKSPTRLIDDLLAQGTLSQAEIARQLGVSRQAVSAAIKRRSQKPTAVD